MQGNTKAFSSFSVDSLDSAHRFYRDVLELEVTEDDMGLNLAIAGGGHVFVYAKEDHQPATFTVLNFQVENLDKAMEMLAERNVRFEIYDTKEIKTDSRGVLMDDGMKVAWFKDPAGNVLSVIESD